jgi:acyl-CoA synthetase (AMP-forming)/AMP-acid ligase II
VQIGALVRRAATQHGDAPCLTERGRSLSFREFDQLTDQFGNALLAKGLQPGDRVGVLLPNGIDCLIAYYAIAKSGLVRIALNARETFGDHTYKLADSGCRALICNDGDEVPETLEHCIRSAELGAMIETGDPSVCSVDRPLDAPYRLSYTGGTTGRPKAVTLTTRGEIAELSAFLSDLMPGMSSADTFLHAAPIAHASGAFFLPSLVRGVHSITMPKFDAAEFIALAEMHRATLTFLVPTMLAMVLEHPKCRAAAFSLRRIAYGASPISPSILAKAENRFGRVFAQTYGQAESPMVITYLAPEDHDRIGSCGRPFSIVEVAIVDDQDRFLGAGEIGEIVCRGTQTMSHYWNNPEATEQVFRNGWLHTGDVGRMDDEGFYYIVDRKGEMLISGGFNVYPREVEEVLMAYNGVIEAAVVGLPDQKWGDRIQAVITVRDGVESEDVLAFASSRLANFKRPKSIDVWPELPKSGAGKILRREVRDRLARETLDGGKRR